ncbi:hypothetical protein TWF481_003176 [Arthrobotrys musiformis]|uniref:BTB domain-containing protein n=1 Tax=Arthrobotrys musiformis TaxID=47236 RepID=A0AAV9VQI5_9PEZI
MSHSSLSSCPPISSRTRGRLPSPQSEDSDPISSRIRRRPRVDYNYTPSPYSPTPSIYTASRGTETKDSTEPEGTITPPSSDGAVDLPSETASQNSQDLRGTYRPLGRRKLLKQSPDGHAETQAESPSIPSGIDFSGMLAKEEFADIAVFSGAESHPFNLHRCILSHSSRRFSNAFAASPDACIMTISTVPTPAFRVVVGYLYSGRVALPIEDIDTVVAVYEASFSLEIPSLTTAILENLQGYYQNDMCKLPLDKKAGLFTLLLRICRQSSEHQLKDITPLVKVIIYHWKVSPESFLGSGEGGLGSSFAAAYVGALWGVLGGLECPTCGPPLALL